MLPFDSQHAVQSTDLSWLAFCYVADELTADDAAAFELRLADDQAARDAVAQAVALSEAIMAVKPTTIPAAEPCALLAAATRPIAPPRRTHYYSYVAFAVAACALLAVGLRFKPDSSVKFANLQDLADASAVAAAWSARLDSLEVSVPVSSAGSEQSSEFTADDVDLLAGQTGDDESGDASYASDVPSWMIDAVHSLQAGDGSEATDAPAAASPAAPASLES